VTISGFGCRRCPPFRCWIDNHSSFPDVCAKAGNGFVGQENCFVASHPTKQLLKNPGIRASAGGRIAGIGQWPRLEATITAGAGGAMGDPL
jgi:hypothetical protein